MKIVLPVLSLAVVALSSCTSQTTAPYMRESDANNSASQPTLLNEKQAFCIDRMPRYGSVYDRTKAYNKCMRNVDDLMRKQREASEEWERNAPIREQQLRMKLDQERAEYEQRIREEKQSKELKDQQEIKEYNKMFNF